MAGQLSQAIESTKLKLRFKLTMPPPISSSIWRGGYEAHNNIHSKKQERLHTLALKGTITQEEFEAKKRQVLGL